MASSFKKTFALSTVMSVMACASVADWYHSFFTYQLRWDKSTHILIFPSLSSGSLQLGHTTLLVG